MSKPTNKATNEPLLAATAPAAMGVPVVAPQGQVIGRTAPQWQEMLAPQGLLFRERVSLMQFLCGACEKRTSFAVGPHPSPSGGRAHLDDEAFKASLAQGLFEVREDSSCLCRYCCHQNRRLRLGLFPARANVPGSMVDVEIQGGLGGLGWPEGETPMLEFYRPFKCSLPCCCCLLNPQEIRAIDTTSQAPMGGAVMDWSCWLCVAPCCCVPRLRYLVHDLVGKAEHQVHVPLCFADGGVNCCAPTCFNPVLSMPVTEPGEDEHLGSVQLHWPGCNVRGLCCAGNANNNYALVFPPGATPEQKVRLLSAMHLIDFNLFEKRGNQK